MAGASPTARGLVIAAPGSGSGKTTVTIGLLAALRRKGLSVQPFKVGPDYLDPSHHARAAGRTSVNLDTWAMSEPLIAAIATRAMQEADLGLVEGVMGLFDGGPDRGLCGQGATVDLAAMLGWPVVLVLDVSGQAETAAAVALGCARYRPDLRMAGVILNRVAGVAHLDLIRPALARAGLPLLGALRHSAEIGLPERHLGLVAAGEQPDIALRIDRIADAIETGVDLDAVVAAAEPAMWFDAHVQGGVRAMSPPGQRIAVANDAAFSFVYPHILSCWREAGAQIVPFSPLDDEAPCADADAVWLPGGYPELHAGRIAAAARFMNGLRALAARSVPIHGECGGYMVLGQGLEEADGGRHAMAGLLPAETSFRVCKLHLGYRRAQLQTNCALGRKGDRLYGHEFHYATLLADPGAPLLAFGSGVETGSGAGSHAGSVSGTFFHIVSAADAER